MSRSTHYMLLSGLAFAVVHAAVKWIPNIPVTEIIAVRALVSLAITLFFIRKAKLSPWGNQKGLLWLRGFAGTFALSLYFYTLQSMPLASAVTIQYLHPLLTVLLASLFLREAPKPLQWLGLFGGFMGILIVRGFDPRVSSADAVIGIAAALGSAIAYNLIRASRGKDHPLVVMFYFPFVSLVVLGPIAVIQFVKPNWIEWLVLAIIGLFTQLAQYYMTLAYQMDRAANVSGLNYIGIIYATGFGYLLFDESVSLAAVSGMALIAASAILTTQSRIPLTTQKTK